MRNDLYQSKPQHEISYFVNARQKTYLTTTEIYIPNNPYEKLEDGYELSDVTPTLSGVPTPTSAEDKEERTARRAKLAVKDIALSNMFELFATFTFKANRYDADACKDKLNGWLKRQRKHDKDFQYVIVPEFHKRCEECVNERVVQCLHHDRPKALHFHALMHGYTEKLGRSINPKTNKPLVKSRRRVFYFPSYTLGHSEVYYIGDTDEDRIRTSFYLLKYIQKEMPAFKNKKRYWASRGLKRPIAIDNPEEWYMLYTPDSARTTEYGMYLFFNNDRIQIFLP